MTFPYLISSIGVSSNTAPVTSTIHLVAITCAWCGKRQAVRIPAGTVFEMRCRFCKMVRQGTT